MPDILVYFAMSVGNDESAELLDARWDRVRRLPGITMVRQTVAMGNYAGEFRMDASITLPITAKAFGEEGIVELLR